MAAPGTSTLLERVLLAYDGSPKAREALFVATYFAEQWRASLAVVTVIESDASREALDDVQVTVISADLPPTQKQWCGNAGVDRVKTVSDHMDADFALKYGTLIKERRYHRRAVFVVDGNNEVTYVAYMPVLGQEPNYDEVLAAARAAL